MGDTELCDIVDILLDHFFEDYHPVQLPAETQDVLRKYSKKSDVLSAIYESYLALPLLVRYAYKGKNTWFYATAELWQGNNYSKLTLSFHIIKVDHIYAIFYPTSEVIREKFHQTGHTLLFHGAKQVSSVDDILNYGIKLDCGRTNLDFSSGSGFYLSDDFRAAKEWVMKNKHRPCAVIIYCVPNNLLQYGETAGLDLNDHQNAWSRIVKYYRTDNNDGFDEMDLALNRSFYKGPVCRNGAMIRKGSHNQPTPLVINGREIQQYCIRRKRLAKKLNSLVVGVVMYV